MKTAQYLKTTIFLALFVIGLIFSGCSNDNPVAMSSNNTVDGKTIKFISLISQESNSLSKVTATQKWINKWSGGTLHLHHQMDGDWTAPYVVVDLKIPANAIDYSKTVSVTFDDADNMGEADLVFGPHGTQFSTPAFLTMECRNFDLSGINPDELKFYYVNGNGQWEEHPYHELVVEPQWGVIRVVDARIPHFSRYAIGME